MGKKFFMALFVFFSLMIIMTGTSWASLLVNPGFETGDFTGWTGYNTSNGQSNPAVSIFDTNNDTVATYSAQFMVGQNAYDSGIYEGGGIYQNFTLATGSFNLVAVADIAVDPDHNNASGGRFSMFLDDILVDQSDFGSTVFSIPMYSQLSGSTLVSGGIHQIKFLIERPYMVPGGLYQYIDNVQITLGQSVIPEPATMFLLGSGLLGLFGFKRKRKVK